MSALAPLFGGGLNRSAQHLLVERSNGQTQGRRQHRVEEAAHAYVAKIKREDPFRPQDERDIQGMCRRVAAAGEYKALAGWREDAGYRVFHFGTRAKARTMQYWIDRSGIVRRP